MKTFTKDPTAVLDYTIDWSAWLTTETISTSAWEVPAGLSKITDDKTNTATTIRLDGGTLGKTYRVRNSIVTSDGRENVQSFNVYLSKT